MIDAVYPYKQVSIKNSKLLRYSIRSLAANCLDLRNVFIVGDFPGFLPGAINIPCKHEDGAKMLDVHKKVTHACMSDLVGDDFLLMNDDFFLNEPFEGKDLPFYAFEGVSGGINGRYDFKIHAPMRMNKEMYMKMPIQIDFSKDVSPRTFFANFYNAPPTFIKDKIIKTGKNITNFEEQIGLHPFFSCSDSAAEDDAFMSFLREKYPESSIYES